ncbi:MAG: DUF1638 domain-containing protein [Candidatus Methanomethylophilaceae archaeon]|nr:DUF1638 domain-containing protein [Candidatus Methanomethylophilaceae archaeon]
MISGILGMIVCPMVDDNLVYSLVKDDEPKRIVIVANGNEGSVATKLSKAGVPYETVSWDDVLSGSVVFDTGMYNLILYMIDLGLHSRPDELKRVVEGLTGEMQPYVDAIGFYLGTCGNYEWNIPAWSDGMGYKPSAMFCDRNGCLCHDCVGINIAGGPRYNELQSAYMGHLYVFPAMATNYDEFMEADQAEAAATEASLTDEMREVLGIEPGRDGYMRWLLSLGGYEYILKIDTGIGDRENFEADLQKVAAKTHLKIKEAEEGWATLQPTDDLYAKCKSFLN